MLHAETGRTEETEGIPDFQKLCRRRDTSIIICDEAQFLQSWQVDELNEIAKDFDIPVLCYGLRTDFRTRAFTGSQRLFEIADRLIELETFCECGKKAVLTAKFNNGKLVLSGNQIDIGGNEKYKAMCYRCWRNFKLNRECEDE